VWVHAPLTLSILEFAITLLSCEGRSDPPMRCPLPSSKAETRAVPHPTPPLHAVRFTFAASSRASSEGLRFGLISISFGHTPYTLSDFEAPRIGWLGGPSPYVLAGFRSFIPLRAGWFSPTPLYAVRFSRSNSALTRFTPLIPCPICAPWHCDTLGPDSANDWETGLT